MFRDKTFNISLAISIAWHLFAAYAVVVVIIPKGLNFARFPTTSFLGPILEGGVFKRQLLDTKTATPTPHRRNFLPEEGLPAPEVSLNGASPIEQLGFRKGIIALKSPFGQAKQLPGAGFKEVVPSGDKGLTGPMRKLSDQGVRIEGELIKRQLLYMPTALKLSDREIGELDEGLSVRLKVLVASSGDVISVERLSSSNSAEIDLKTMRYVRKFVFAQQTGPHLGATQQGIISVRLK